MTYVSADVHGKRLQDSETLGAGPTRVSHTEGCTDTDEVLVTALQDTERARVPFVPHVKVHADQGLATYAYAVFSLEKVGS